ncbi:ABC transporter substrate-binding protein [Paraburkholderia sp. BCC1885]|uniref:ABC transporter substrate-binding protein n=1 Tax=Paraburkholderia sp. BCC1885 TaxID=2562669 RepID=UPI0011825057|nr:ABC transporter substrate-binding protein [Paraburkholderia sp. BCC1885]
MTIGMHVKARLRGFGAVFIAMILLASMDVCTAAQPDPVKIRLGYGVAVEEPVWLVIAKPALAVHQGHEYSLQPSRFSGADKRMQAFAAGALDVSTVSANAAIFAAAEGLDFKIIGSLSRESARGFATQFMVRADSPIRTAADLKGKTIGINGFSGSGNLWVDAYLKNHGMSQDDVTLVPEDFAAQGDALRSGKIDAGMFPQPFAALMQKQGGARVLFSSKDAVPQEEELMLIVARTDFLKAHPDAVKAFMADVVSATTYYAQHMQQARQDILDAKLVRVAPDVYLHMTDYYRDPTCRPDLAELEMMQDEQVKAGFQQKRADLKTRVDDEYLPAPGKS